VNIDSEPPEELYSPDLTGADERLTEIVKSYSSFGEFSSFIKQGATFTLYEGLPHDVWEPEACEEERKKAKILEIDGTPFYAGPIILPPNTTSQLHARMTNRRSFVPFRGYKTCGGFHADWCLVFQEGDQEYNAFLCFGCHELIVYHEGRRIIYCDIWNSKQFEEILNPLHVHRPAERVD